MSLHAQALRYWPYYCEENIWHLCHDARAQADARWVSFVSNAEQRVAMWRQRAALSDDEPVVWDYHVVLLVRHEAMWWIWDLDSTMGPRIEARAWLQGTFQPVVTPAELHPRFRLVEAEAFRRRFASDRRHMRRPGGLYQAPPPPWPTIGDGHNLERFIDMTDADFMGEIVGLQELRRRVER